MAVVDSDYNGDGTHHCIHCICRHCQYCQHFRYWRQFSLTVFVTDIQNRIANRHWKPQMSTKTTTWAVVQLSLIPPAVLVDEVWNCIVIISNTCYSIRRTFKGLLFLKPRFLNTGLRGRPGHILTFWGWFLVHVRNFAYVRPRSKNGAKNQNLKQRR